MVKVHKKRKNYCANGRIFALTSAGENKLRITYQKNDIIVKELECFNLPLTLDCGQAFGWSESGGVWSGVAAGRYLELTQDSSSVVFKNTTAADFEFWSGYFDFERDYAALLKGLESDAVLKSAVRSYYGIRILRQEPWEALCSFIISANNNIPRIKGIIARLRRAYGTQIAGEAYSFPEPQTLAALCEEDLAVIRAGFRAKYILDAARRVASGELDLEAVKHMDVCTANEELKKVKGVGDKVAQCTLLYGFNMLDAFPVDVWVRRVMAQLYPDGLPECAAGIRGVAQQYLFHYIRQQ